MSKICKGRQSLVWRLSCLCETVPSADQETLGVKAWDAISFAERRPVEIVGRPEAAAGLPADALRTTRVGSSFDPAAALCAEDGKRRAEPTSRALLSKLFDLARMVLESEDAPKTHASVESGQLIHSSTPNDGYYCLFSSF